MTAFNLIVRSLIILIFIFWQTYWKYTARIAYQRKPRLAKASTRAKAEYIFDFFLKVFVVCQLLGLQILPMPHSIILQSIGLILVIIGVSISTAGRKEIADNWTHAAEFQIKKQHALVTTGIYRYIRHPIYSGIIFASVGVELAVQSYLFLAMLLLLFFLAYFSGKREEELLLGHFTKKYSTYKKQTKMLIPYIF